MSTSLGIPTSSRRLKHNDFMRRTYKPNDLMECERCGTLVGIDWRKQTVNEGSNSYSYI